MVLASGSGLRAWQGFGSCSRSGRRLARLPERRHDGVAVALRKVRGEACELVRHALELDERSSRSRPEGAETPPERLDGRGFATFP